MCYIAGVCLANAMTYNTVHCDILIFDYCSTEGLVMSVNVIQVDSMGPCLACRQSLNLH